MVSSRLAKLSKLIGYFPLADERADLIPYHTMRMVGNERTKQMLAHGVEEAEVLGEQGVDGLEDVLQIVGLHCRQLLRRPGVYLRTLTACGRFEVNWSGSRSSASC